MTGYSRDHVTETSIYTSLSNSLLEGLQHCLIENHYPLFANRKKNSIHHLTCILGQTYNNLTVTLKFIRV